MELWNFGFACGILLAILYAAWRLGKKLWPYIEAILIETKALIVSLRKTTERNADAIEVIQKSFERHATAHEDIDKSLSVMKDTLGEVARGINPCVHATKEEKS